jgi:hypothetical protein
MKIRRFGVKWMLMIAVAFLVLSGYAAFRDLAKQRKWIDQRDSYEYRRYRCNGPEKDCQKILIDKAIPKGFSELDDWVFENL